MSIAEPSAIALNRFGLGARPDEDSPSDAKAWLLGQFDRYDPQAPAFAALPDPAPIVVEYRARIAEMARAAKAGAAAPAPPAPTMMASPPGAPMMAGGGVAPVAPPAAADAMKLARKDMREDVNSLYRAAVGARGQAALTASAPFVERLVHFWANHFAISAEKPEVNAYAGDFELRAIRPHVLGRFEDMLVAVERHPAMMIYLDQVTSIGPNSDYAQRVAARRPDRRPGLNENLAREIMELHTLGVRSGYAQADVTEFARAMTGWSIGGYRGGAPLIGDEDGGEGRFLFRPMTHEPGDRTIVGRLYPDSGEGQARAALADFAVAPATASHVATKLARHFAGDTPPPAMVARLTAAFTASRGDLPTVYRALIASPEAWLPQPAKFKTPWEWTISSLRAMGRTSLDGIQLASVLTQLGQPVWRPGSPAGWDDTASSWAAPDALIRRVELAQRLAAPAAARIDARVLAPEILPASFDPAAREEIARAESPATALALLLVSPGFLRR